MKAKKKKVKAKSKSSKRSAKRRAKDLAPRAKAKSVKGGLVPAVNVAPHKIIVASPPSFNPGVQAMGDGSV